MSVSILGQNHHDPSNSLSNRHPPRNRIENPPKSDLLMPPRRRHRAYPHHPARIRFALTYTPIPPIAETTCTLKPLTNNIPLRPQHLDPLRQRVRNSEPAEALSEQVPLELEVREREFEDQTAPGSGVQKAHALRRDTPRERPVGVYDLVTADMLR